jgi:uncharacterized phage protein (TIGR01671 family)
MAYIKDLTGLTGEWFNKNGRIHQVSSIDFVVKEVCVNIPGLMAFGFNSVELMQYIGLKDRKDKEIYDGDIVKFQYIGLSYKIGQVGFIENSSIIGIKVYDEVNDFYNGVYSLYSIIREDKIRKIEVIGNVYENIDLLAGGHHEKF